MADNKKLPYISSLYIKEFRCFEEKKITFDAPVILIEGHNGTGKTTLIEALHFVCYVRSFRTATPRDIVSHNKHNFFVRVNVSNQNIQQEDVIQVGFSGNRRLVKINDQSVTSYKQLVDVYRAVTITENDLDLIEGGPAFRRQFIDQAMGIQDPAWSAYLKKASLLIEQRSHVLYTGTCTPSLYEAWTAECWNFSHHIQQARTEYLAKLEHTIRHLIQTHVFLEKSLTIQLSYKPKKTCLYAEYNEFLQANPTIYHEETQCKRALFGFHLDDIEISFSGYNARHYASRGQQKLILLVIKAAQISILPPSQGPTLIMLDDFITDLDEKRTQQLLTLFMTLGTQLIVTTPKTDTIIHSILSQSAYPHQIIAL
jgi:DNA replication and repair protein RecF